MKWKENWGRKVVEPKETPPQLREAEAVSSTVIQIGDRPDNGDTDIESGVSSSSDLTDPSTPSEVAEDGGSYAYVFGAERPHGVVDYVMFPFMYICQVSVRLTVPSCSLKTTWSDVPKWPFAFLLSVVWISVISYAIVEVATLGGCSMRIPSAFMGLIVLAAGTSVPDMLASVASVRKGKANMAVGNALGSNFFNILVCLGLPYVIKGLMKSAGGSVAVHLIGVVVIPIIILFTVILVLIAALMACKWTLGRPLGIVLFSIYGLFVVYLLLDVFLLKLGGSA